MAYRNLRKKVAKIRIAGPDAKGIIATITRFAYTNDCNIEDIDQRILEGYLIMNMKIDFSDLKIPLSDFIKNLKKTAASIGMEATCQPLQARAIKNVAILVTRESHCLLDLLKNMRAKKLRGRPVVIIGNHPDLKGVAGRYKVPFYFVSANNRKEHENNVLKLLQKFAVDLVVLARYMQILSPEFVFKNEGKIINIHPSLLPAFPGPRSYHQAYNKGVEIVGVTAHFATTDLDEGPIITQGCFKVDKTRNTVDDFIKKGRDLEAKTLTRAVKLFLEDRLTLRRGKVFDNKKAYTLAEKTHDFYH